MAVTTTADDYYDSPRSNSNSVRNSVEGCRCREGKERSLVADQGGGEGAVNQSGQTRHSTRLTQEQQRRGVE